MPDVKRSNSSYLSIQSLTSDILVRVISNFDKQTSTCTCHTSDLKKWGKFWFCGTFNHYCQRWSFGEWHSRKIRESLHVCHSPWIPIPTPIPSQFLGGGGGSITSVTIFPPKNKKRNRLSEIEWRSRQPATNRRKHGDRHCQSLRRTWAYLPIRVVCQYLLWGLQFGKKSDPGAKGVYVLPQDFELQLKHLWEMDMGLIIKTEYIAKDGLPF